VRRERERTIPWYNKVSVEDVLRVLRDVTMKKIGFMREELNINSRSFFFVVFFSKIV
jgi:hypothetical protein